MSADRKYRFSWDLLGDLELGRPNMGKMARLEVYRLMKFSFRDVIERRHGADEADRIFYESGYLAGQALYAHMIGPQKDINELFLRLQTVFRELGIGILRVEEVDPAAGRFVLTVSEDLDCSGLPESDAQVCTYDEGFLSAILESFSGSRFTVKEVDCWCSGDRTCRFSAQASDMIHE